MTHLTQSPTNGIGQDITDAGLAALAALFCGQPGSAPFLNVVLGTGGSLPINANTTLDAQVLSMPAAITVVGPQVTLQIQVNPGVLNCNIQEMGITNANGVLYYRETQAPMTLSATVGGIFILRGTFGRNIVTC